MMALARGFWAVSAVGLILGLAFVGASCDIDGVTPNCSSDGGDCVTPPGDAYPAQDSGVE
jgi:hypothetical protein